MTAPNRLHIGKYAFILDIANAIVLLLLFLLIVYYYEQLPEEVPIRFDAKGAPVALRGKATLFIFPLLALVISIIVFMIRRQPNMINYPVKVTDENEAALYKESSQLLSGIMLSTNLMILYACWKIIQVALEKASGSPVSFIWVPILIIAVLAVNAYRRMKKLG